jgi:hypothetical protein
VKRVPVKAEGQRKRLLYALQDVAKRPTGVPLKKEGEFVFPHPCKEANGAHCCDQTAGNALEARVPLSLTIRVVDIVKVVEV